MRKRDLFESLTPRKWHMPAYYRWLQYKNNFEPEMTVIGDIVGRGNCFVDVGCNIGVYTYHFSRFFREVKSFEPLPDISYRVEVLKLPGQELLSCALSDRADQLTLHVPIVDGKPGYGLASLEKRNVESMETLVQVRTLDSFNFSNVDLIKIDVEGHEQSVIKGGSQTLQTDKPAILIEIEQRHLDGEMHDVFHMIQDLGYTGYFLEEGRLQLLEAFSYERNQKPYLNNVSSKNYINNFMFFHRDRQYPKLARL